MAGNYNDTYNVDIVMCIDSTGSMGSLLDMVKQNAINFYNDFTSELAKKDKQVNELRVKVISFRDYIADGENAMLRTDFFSLPQQAAEFEQVVRGIMPEGGGDEPEDSLEALAYAIKSKWTGGGTKRRHVIVLWTDASAHELGFGKKAPNYPQKMAKDFSELTEWWGFGQYAGVMERNAKRLLIYAPPVEPWNTIAQSWDNTLFYPSKAGSGLEDKTYQEILNTICSSV